MKVREEPDLLWITEKNKRKQRFSTGRGFHGVVLIAVLGVGVPRLGWRFSTCGCFPQFALLWARGVGRLSLGS